MEATTPAAIQAPNRSRRHRRGQHRRPEVPAAFQRPPVIAIPRPLPEPATIPSANLATIPEPAVTAPAESPAPAVALPASVTTPVPVQAPEPQLAPLALEHRAAPISAPINSRYLDPNWWFDMETITRPWPTIEPRLVAQSADWTWLIGPALAVVGLAVVWSAPIFSTKVRGVLSVYFVAMLLTGAWFCVGGNWNNIRSLCASKSTLQS